MSCGKETNGALGIVEGRILLNAIFCLQRVILGMKINLFIFNGSPKPLEKDIVPLRPFAIPHDELPIVSPFMG